MGFEIAPIGHVEAGRTAPVDDDWGGTTSRIRLDPSIPDDALVGLDGFSHAEILYCFHQVDPTKVVSGARHPRNNTAWPKVGIFAQRGKNRPNRLGSTICRVVGVEGRVLTVAELDAIDGTPVIDVKPVMSEFLPREPVFQPAWSHALMAAYWKTKWGCRIEEGPLSLRPLRSFEGQPADALIAEPASKRRQEP